MHSLKAEVQNKQANIISMSLRSNFKHTKQKLSYFLLLHATKYLEGMQVHTCRILCINILGMYNKSLGNFLNFVNDVEKLEIHHRILPQYVLPGVEINYTFSQIWRKLNI